jgi:hypothetical protein
MMRESEIHEGLERAFLPALLLTGSVEGAEAAVLDGIAAVESDGISRDSLLVRTVRSAIQLHGDFSDQCAPPFSILPFEVRRILLLAPNPRCSFVLRFLLGMTPEICSDLLHLTMHEVEGALRTGLRELPSLNDCHLAAPDYPERT